MVESVKDGIELDSEFLDELFVAIRDRLPGNKWVPITKDHQRVIAGVKHIIDCCCYGEDFDLALHENMTHFKKISGFEPMPKVFDGYFVKNHPAGYWAAQDALKLENQKRAYDRARRGDLLQHNKELKKKRTYD